MGGHYITNKQFKDNWKVKEKYDNTFYRFLSVTNKERTMIAKLDYPNKTE